MNAAHKEETIEPNWHAVAINETSYWKKEWIEEHGIESMYGVYIVNLNEVTYCCSLTPSYCLYFIESFPIHKDGVDPDEGERESIYSDTLDADCHTEEVSYFNCGGIDRLDDKWKDRLDVDLDDAETDNEKIDAVREHYQSCPTF